MGKYYFLETALPSLQIGMRSDITFLELLELFRMNLSKSDLAKINAIRSYIDLSNVKQLLKKEPLDTRGNLNEKELDEALLTREILPQYLFEFFDEKETDEERIRTFSKIFALFFADKQKKSRGFIKKYWEFERNWRLIMTVYRAKKLNRDITVELQYEDFTDPFVAELLAQKDHPQLEFPFEFVELGEKLQEAPSEPKAQYQLMAEYRFREIEEMSQNLTFSIDWLIAYMVRLMIVEDYMALEDRRGSELLNNIVKENI